MGAMENAGVRDVPRRVRSSAAGRPASAYERRANTILHEMAHMWFGDLVTMKWWDDLWLNESFAEWASHHAVDRGDRVRRGMDQLLQRPQDLGLPAGPAPVDPPDRGRQLRPRGRRGQLRRHHLRQGRLGAAAARRLGRARSSSSPGCAAYFAAHAYGNTELTDLLTALEETSGRELGSGPRSGSRPSGVNTVRPVFEVDDDGTFTSLHGRADRAPRASRPCAGTASAIGLYDLTDGRLVRRTSARDRRRRATRPRSPSWSASAQPDLRAAQRRRPDATPRSGSTSARWRRSSTTSTRSTDSLPRALCWGAAWDMTRDAEMRRQRLGRPGAARHRQSRPTCPRVRSLIARSRRRRSRSTPRRPTGPRCGHAGKTGCCACCSSGRAGQRPAAGVRARPRRRRAHRDEALDAARRPARRHAGHSTAWPSTPTCAGTLLLGAGPRRPGRRRRDRRRARPRQHDLRPGVRRRGAGGDADRRGQGRGVGDRRRSATTSPTRPCAALLAFTQPGQDDVLRPTSTSTSTSPRHIWEEQGHAHAPRPCSSSCSRRALATQETPRPTSTPGWRQPTPTRPHAASHRGPRRPRPSARRPGRATQRCPAERDPRLRPCSLRLGRVSRGGCASAGSLGRAAARPRDAADQVAGAKADCMVIAASRLTVAHRASDARRR